MDRLLVTIMEDYYAGDFASMATRLPGSRSLAWVVEPVILTLLAAGAVGGLLAGLGEAFWAVWHGLAALGFLGVKWRRRPVLAVDKA